MAVAVAVLGPGAQPAATSAPRSCGVPSPAVSPAPRHRAAQRPVPCCRRRPRPTG